MSANIFYQEIEPLPGRRLVVLEAEEVMDGPYEEELYELVPYGSTVWEEPVYYVEEPVYENWAQGPTPRLMAFLMVGLLVMGLAVISMLSSGFALPVVVNGLANGLGVVENGAEGETAVSPQPQSQPVAAAPVVASGLISPIFSPEVQHWAPQIVGWAEQHGIDPNMVATIMQVESCGDPQAISRAGAQGLFQVMPYHFVAGENSLDPNTNALRGMTYFVERLAQTGGDVGRAFAGYNGGHVAAGTSWSNWANETQRYFVWTTGLYDEASAGLTTSPTLERWMAAGGASLCRQAAGRLGL